MSSACEYTFDSVVRIVIVSIVITLLIIGFFISVVWLYLCKRNAHKFDISYDPHATQLSIIKSNQFNNNNQSSRFAFDNPHFKDDENEFIVTNNDKLGFNYNNADATILSNGPALRNDFNQSNGQANPIVNYVLNKNNKVSSSKSVTAKKSWEDGDVYKPQTISVDLIGHDFTGLGFNITGNMRDGIRIKDVLSRGPANESRKIKPGDKLSSITISMNNMVYEDALTILSYASPYKVTLNLQRDQMSQRHTNQKASSKTLKTQRTLSNNNYQKTMLHPLYKTRSVDNLIEIGKCDLNYGTAQSAYSRNSAANQQCDDDEARKGYGRVINRFKQIFTYLNPTANSHSSSEYAASSSEMMMESKKRPLASIQNLFKSNKMNWSDEYSGQHQDNLNAVVVGNTHSLAVGNLAFKDDDEDEEFRRQYQLSQLKYQQQQQAQQQTDLYNSLQQHHSLQHQNVQTDVHYNRNTSYSTHQQQHATSQPTNLIKYHQQADLSQVDGMQQASMNQFVSINLNEHQQPTRTNRQRDHEMDYTNSRKGNSTQLNDSYNSLTPHSSPSFTSVPLNEPDPNFPCPPNTTVAEIHAVADQSIGAQSVDHHGDDILDSQNMSNKPRSSSMGDLPIQSTTTVSMNPQVLDHNSTSIINQNHQSTLERAISLDLTNQTDRNTMMINSKLSKSAFTTSKFNKEDQNRNKRLIKMKNQPLRQQSLGDLSYEQQKNMYMLGNEKSSQPSLTSSCLQASSLSKLSNQSKSIRNSLSTNSTCSSPSTSSDTNKMEYDDASILMLKSSPEENNSILVARSAPSTEYNHIKQQDTLDDDDRLPLDDDELEAKESILLVNDQHKANTMINDDQSSDGQLFANKEQAKKIINDVFGMSSIRTLNDIKSDKQLNDLFQLNKPTENSPKDAMAPKKPIQSNTSNFRITSTKKEFPVVRMSSLTSDHSSLFPSNVPSLKANNFFTKETTQSGDHQSINKENEMKKNLDHISLSKQETSKVETADEIGQLRNRVSKLKKEFSLRQKEIENQNRQNIIGKYRKLSDAQTSNAKSVLSVKENRKLNKAAGSITKKQEQIVNTTPLDFEPWTFNNSKE